MAAKTEDKETSRTSDAVFGLERYTLDSDADGARSSRGDAPEHAIAEPQAPFALAPWSDFQIHDPGAQPITVGISLPQLFEFASTAPAPIVGTNNDDWIWGSSLADAIYGHDGNDHLYGKEGADRIFGGDGDDVVSGGAGNDELDGGRGDDILDGGEGFDAIDYQYAGEGRLIDLSQGLAYKMGHASVDRDIIMNVEGAGGSNFDDYMIGAEDTVFLAGRYGDDTIVLNSQAATYYEAGASGGQDNDILRNDGPGAVHLYGDEGDDTLIGGRQADFLAGGDGVDVIHIKNENTSVEELVRGDRSGGADYADIFVIDRIGPGSAGMGHATITDYNDNLDKIDASAWADHEVAIDYDAVENVSTITFGAELQLQVGAYIDANDFIV